MEEVERLACERHLRRITQPEIDIDSGPLRVAASDFNERCG